MYVDIEDCLEVDAEVEADSPVKLIDGCLCVRCVRITEVLPP
jgi:hypothetical protein